MSKRYAYYWCDVKDCNEGQFIHYDGETPDPVPCSCGGIQRCDGAKGKQLGGYVRIFDPVNNADDNAKQCGVYI